MLHNSNTKVGDDQYLDKHFLLVHGPDHLPHIGALLLQQLQLLTKQAH